MEARFGGPPFVFGFCRSAPHRLKSFNVVAATCSCCSGLAARVRPRPYE